MLSQEGIRSIRIYQGVPWYPWFRLHHRAKYEKSGITGEQYIKKIIQIPIMVPEWNSSDIANLIEEVIIKNLMRDIF